MICYVSLSLEQAVYMTYPIALLKDFYASTW